MTQGVCVFFSVIYGLIHYRFGQKVVLLDAFQLYAGGIAIRPPVYLSVGSRMIIMTFGLRLFACFYSIHQDAPILHPLLFRDGIQEQKTSICSKATNGGLVIAGRKRKLQGHWLPTKEVPSTGLPSRVDTVPPQPIQCSRTRLDCLQLYLR